MKTSGHRIIVGGLAGLHPVGGMAWHYLQYVVGLSRLGHDVYYHEDTWTWPFHPVRNEATEQGDYSASFIDDYFRRYAPGLRDRWHYLHLHEQSFGMSRKDFDEVARTADLFLNISGSNFIPDGLSPSCCKVFLDTDPGYNQILLVDPPEWAEFVDRWQGSVAEHDRHFTFAENIHGPGCLVPKLDFRWQTTRMPVVLDLWDRYRCDAPPDAPWSTIMTWNAFKGRLEHDGVEYMAKGAEFEKIMDLPGRVSGPLEVAVGGTKAPMDRLAANGWRVEDAPRVTLSPHDYGTFISRSRGEISAAKHIYVAMQTGWFSERTTCYLASGRPAVVQDTGFSSCLPVSEGLLAFSTMEEARAAIEEVESDYPRHAAAALEVARECFGSDRVLSALIEDVDSGPGAGPREAPHPMETD